MLHHAKAMDLSSPPQSLGSRRLSFPMISPLDASGVATELNQLLHRQHSSHHNQYPAPYGISPYSRPQEQLLYLQTTQQAMNVSKHLGTNSSVASSAASRTVQVSDETAHISSVQSQPHSGGSQSSVLKPSGDDDGSQRRSRLDHEEGQQQLDSPHQQPPEAAYLTGGAGGNPKYGNYAPPLKWRTNSNARERRVGGSSSGNPAYVAVVGAAPVVWTDEAERRDRSVVLEEKTRHATSLSPLDDTIAQLSRSSVLGTSVQDASASPNHKAPEEGASALETSARETSVLSVLLPPALRSLSVEPQSPAQPHSVVVAGRRHKSSGTPESAVVASSPTLPASVRTFYSESQITPFRRVHVRQEEEMAPTSFSSTDATVDSRRVWGPKEERKFEGTSRAWWQ